MIPPDRDPSPASLAERDAAAVGLLELAGARHVRRLARVAARRGADDARLRRRAAAAAAVAVGDGGGELADLANEGGDLIREEREEFGVQAGGELHEGEVVVVVAERVLKYLGGGVDAEEGEGDEGGGEAGAGDDVELLVVRAGKLGGEDERDRVAVHRVEDVAELADREGDRRAFDLRQPVERVDHPVECVVRLVELERRHVPERLEVGEPARDPLDADDRGVLAALQQVELGLRQVLLEARVVERLPLHLEHHRVEVEHHVPPDVVDALRHLRPRLAVVAVELRDDEDPRRAAALDRRADVAARLPVPRVRRLHAHRQQEGGAHAEGRAAHPVLPVEVVRRDHPRPERRDRDREQHLQREVADDRAACANLGREGE